MLSKRLSFPFSAVMRAYKKEPSRAAQNVAQAERTTWRQFQVYTPPVEVSDWRREGHGGAVAEVVAARRARRVGR